MQDACGERRVELGEPRATPSGRIRTRFACRADRPEESGGAREGDNAGPRLSFGVIDQQELGSLEAQNSIRVGRYWEFVLSYRNTTAATIKPLGVECMTMAGRRILNVNKRTEWDGVPKGGFVVFKVPVEDAGEIPDYGSCRLVTK